MGTGREDLTLRRPLFCPVRSRCPGNRQAYLTFTKRCPAGAGITYLRGRGGWIVKPDLHMPESVKWSPRPVAEGSVGVMDVTPGKELGDLMER